MAGNRAALDNPGLTPGQGKDSLMVRRALPMTVIIGIGNADRGDDAVGLVVARKVRDAAPAGVTVTELDGDQLALLPGAAVTSRLRRRHPVFG